MNLFRIKQVDFVVKFEMVRVAVVMNITHTQLKLYRPSRVTT